MKGTPETVGIYAGPLPEMPGASAERRARGPAREQDAPGHMGTVRRGAGDSHCRPRRRTGDTPRKGSGQEGGFLRILTEHTELQNSASHVSTGLPADNGLLHMVLSI